MRPDFVRLSLFALVLLLATGCASLPLNETVIVVERTLPSDDGDELAEVMRNDLALATHRSRERDQVLAPKIASRQADQTRTLPRDISQYFSTITTLPIPVAGVRARDLRNTWGDPRDGGKRRHRGIDIFAPRGTEVVSVTDGIVSFKGTQPKGGLCVWVVDDISGYSFYYAHLDAFARIEEGQSVRRGEVLGYVGTTGNARNTPPHLHFSVVRNDESINPYPLLTKAVTATAPAILSGGFGGGGADR
jgi:peptidoglycan LD-endopeptidase LytH